MRRLLILSILLIPVATFAASRTGLAPRTGLLLVATVQIQDPRFQESVVLITRHDRHGTEGLILNRPLGKLPPDLERTFRTLPQGIFWGGPVEPLQASALLFGAKDPPGTQLLRGLHLLRGEQLSIVLRHSPLASGELCVYLGYAGWAPSQLAAEIDRGDWSVLPVELDTLRRHAPRQLWQKLAPTPDSPWV